MTDDDPRFGVFCNEAGWPMKFVCKGFAERQRDYQRMEREERKAQQMHVMHKISEIPPSKDTP